MASVLKPSEVQSRYYPVRSQNSSGFVEAEVDIIMEAVPSNTYIDRSNPYIGMLFKMGTITCGITSESLTKARYGAIKIPLIYDTIRKIGEQDIPLRVAGAFRIHRQDLLVDYEKTAPFIKKAIKQLR